MVCGWRGSKMIGHERNPRRAEAIRSGQGCNSFFILGCCVLARQYSVPFYRSQAVWHASTSPSSCSSLRNAHLSPASSIPTLSVGLHSPSHRPLCLGATFSIDGLFHALLNFSLRLDAETFLAASLPWNSEASPARSLQYPGGLW